MDETSQQSEEIDHRYAQRDLIRQSLNEIASDLSMEMRDPSDEDWEKVTAIVCRILQKRIGGGRLRGKELINLPKIVAIRSVRIG